MKIYVSNKVIFFNKIHILGYGIGLILLLFVITNIKMSYDSESITLINSNGIGKYLAKGSISNIKTKEKKEGIIKTKAITNKHLKLSKKNAQNQILSVTTIKQSSITDKKL